MKPIAIAPGALVRVRWPSHSDNWPAYTVVLVVPDGVLLQGRTFNEGPRICRHDGTHTFIGWEEIVGMEIET